MPAADPALLCAVADELEDLRAGVDAISHLLSDLVRRVPPAERLEVMSDAQRLDEITQRLQALSGLARAVAAGEAPEAAVAAIPLADMAQRLRPALSRQADQGAAAGDLQLFD
ncbi:hypothetical protein [Brevundimonas sp. PAMC22021]|uniref:hypothetical protein n=1 Tax=Brevundimonas sp. PAMC22021 TaxID=2861285 RepID=UPI001C62F600|nr:hypothetical protein [Brevundimonas sp. PAMC22021]QYF86182.1 hypothetical protein KY493_10040 [Brevundimonas sp. PAMC22021]